MSNKISIRFCELPFLCCAFILLSACSTTGADTRTPNAVDLRKQAVMYAASGDYARAAPLLDQAARLGYYTAQMEYAVLLDTSPVPVNDDIKAFAWYSVVMARNGSDTGFAQERRSVVATRLDVEALRTAKQLAGKLVEQYAGSTSKSSKDSSTKKIMLLGPASVEEALESVRKKDGVEIRVQQGWVVANDAAQMTIWSFTPEGHPAHPSAVARTVVKTDGAYQIRMNVLCEADKIACDNLVVEFERLNQSLSEHIRKEKGG